MPKAFRGYLVQIALILCIMALFTSILNFIFTVKGACVQIAANKMNG